MRKIFLIISGAIVVVIALGLWMLTGGTAITQRVVAAKSLAAATAWGPHTVLTSNGSAFVAYNYLTGVSKAVSTDTGPDALSTTDTLSTSSDRRYILFHQASTTDGSALLQTLQASNMDTSFDYWWVYNIAAQTYKPLPSGTLQARLQNGHIYALVSGTNGESINSYAPDSLDELSTVSITPSVNFYATAQGYLLQDTSGIIYFTKDGIINQQLSAGSTLVTVTDHNQRAIITKHQGKDVSLLNVNLQDGTTTTIAKNVTNQPLWQSSGLILYNTSASNAKFFVYDTSTKKTTAWNFRNDSYPGGDATALLDATTAVMTDTSGNYFLTGRNLHRPVQL